jgi:thiol:disulfide interchange protein DsbD
MLLWTVCLAVLHAQELPNEPLPGVGETGVNEVTVELGVEPDQQASGHPIVAVATFDMPDGWYIYADSVNLELSPIGGEDGPVRVGELYLPAPERKYDEILEKEVDYYAGTLRIRRVLEIAGAASAGRLNLTLRASYQACSPDVCYPPETVELEADVEVLGPGAEAVDVNLPEKAPRAEVPDTKAVGEESDSEQLQEKGLLATVALSFLAGLALALTPCVYPMIPITVSVIGATATESRLSGLGRSLVYVLGISLMYAVLGLVAAATGRAFGTLLQHPAVYIGLAVIFVLLAGAMFDLFSIELFSTSANRLQQKVRGRAGLIGIMALGMLSGVALTPCSAPVIIAAMGYVLKTSNLAMGFLIFFSIAWGMGTPLVILGTFSGMISSMPKSGGWQETVKHVFGFGLIGAAVYFLGQSGLLGTFWFDMVVAAFLLVTSVFAGAFDHLDPSSTWWPRACKAVGLILLASAVVIFVEPFLESSPAALQPEETIQWRDSLDQARDVAREQGQPLMIYFWQEYCPACRKLENSVFPHPSVLQASEELVCVKFDGTESKSPDVEPVLNRYEIRGFPTIVFVTPEGEMISDLTLVGYAPPERLAGAMRKATEAGD